MKIKLHKPKQSLWNVALILLLLGLAGALVPIPLLSQVSFYLVALAAVLLLLGTWVF